MASPATNTPNRDIDFLPDVYREAGIQRKNITLRAVVIAAFVSLVGFAVVYQQHLRIVAQEQLAALLPSYEQSQAETKRLAEMQTQLQSVQRQAELYTYLRHPWPRSQILAALTEPLPDEIQLQELSIVREPLATSGGDAAPPSAKPSEAAAAKLNPAQRDLATLRDHWDRTQIVVKLSGQTDDPLALHRYLEELNRIVMFSRVEEGVIESLPGDSKNQIHFAARVIVRPGYGQPKGPTLESATVTATSEEH
jgi:Tfp pilus assembly protein PilN